MPRALVVAFAVSMLTPSLIAGQLAVPSQYPTIQQAVDAASDGDVVVVAPDSQNGGHAYFEHLDFGGKAITVTSSGGAAVTTIDGTHNGRCVAFDHGEGRGSVLAGFTLVNGAGDHGAGVYCPNSSPTVRDNVIALNSVSVGGAGLWTRGGSPLVESNLFRDNSAAGDGGGITLISSSAVIRNNLFLRNVAGNGHGAGIVMDGSTPSIVNNTFSGNTAAQFGGALSLVSGSRPQVINCICWQDAPNEIHVDGSSVGNVSYSDVQGGFDGTSNLASDPRLVDVTHDDAHLGLSSPCIDTGDNASPDLPTTDKDGSPRIVDGNGDCFDVVDMGAYERSRSGHSLVVPSTEHATIQSAIDDAVDGDTVLVSPDSVHGGPYFENLDFRGKAITVTSVSGAAATTIDGSQSGSVVTFEHGEGPNSILSGFTITHGDSDHGGGVICPGSSPTICHNVIAGNHANFGGAGVWCQNGAATIQANMIRDNFAEGDGGGVTLRFTSAIVRGNVFLRNTAGNGHGGGLVMDGSTPTLVNNTFFHNAAAESQGGGGAISAVSGSTPVIVNCICWEDSPGELHVVNSTALVTFSDVHGGPAGSGNVDSEPSFVDPSQDDLRLRDGSACVDAGDNAAPQLAALDLDDFPRIVDGDGDGTATVDMGAYEKGPKANTPPTANAGADQSIHAGQLVQLDGGGSFDDDTPTVDLQFAWSFVQVPDGSSVTLSGDRSEYPFFVPDLPGTYVVQLVVTDAGNLSSAADSMQVSSYNLPPTANAGSAQTVIVGEDVQLDGNGSTDPDDDDLAFDWTFLSVPAGSSALIHNADGDQPDFTPDVPGVYVVQLVVSDPFTSSAPATVTITAISQQVQYAEMLVLDSITFSATLPAPFVTNSGNRQALGNFLTQALTAMQQNDLALARLKLQDAIARTDGWALRGRADGNGPGRDWIVDRAASIALYTALTAAKQSITP